MAGLTETYQRLGELFERFMARRRTRDEELPAYYRKMCLACEDTGVEGYLHPQHPEVPYARPCKHCARGKVTLTAWMRPAGKDGKSEVHAGPYYGMDAVHVSEIMARPCAHSPLPIPGQTQLEPHRTVVE